MSDGRESESLVEELKARLAEVTAERDQLFDAAEAYRTSFFDKRGNAMEWSVRIQNAKIVLFETVFALAAKIREERSDG